MLRRAHRLGGRLCLVRSFTLVELLVVLSIIALLMAILLPSLKRARQQANEVVCAARLKQWGVAFHCYAGENRGALPHCDGLDRGPSPITDPGISKEDLADWHGWIDLLPQTIGYKPWRDYPIRQHPDRGTFYQCPTARLAEPENLYGYWPRIDGWFSYAMNACLELDRNAWRPPDGLDWPMPSFLNTARIACPQRVVLLFDQLLDPRKGYGGAVRYRDAGKHCGGYPIAFSARHPRGRSTLGGNILFCDGHAGWQRTVWKPTWEDWQIGRQQGPPRDDPDWYPYPPARDGAK
ncbi:MAG TPA: prepilin-type N-terminal cleavage/methylation domain-containing protein [Phycisphaerae bacterium]|nr:prepilin-type N-terminal cleavage/methylation domain-containing protein [Phycisphaerae bacterium]